MPPSHSASEITAPRSIHGDCGSYVLAVDETAAKDYAKAEGYRIVRDVGWMHEGWDYENCETEEEFRAESGFETYWLGCTVAEGTQPRAGLLRAWEVTSDG